MNRRNLRACVTFFGIAIPGALVATAGFLHPLDSGSLARGADQVRLPASDTVSWCPGPFAVGGDAAGTDADFSTDAAPPATVQAASAPTTAPDGTITAAGIRSTSLGGGDNYVTGRSNGFVSGDDTVGTPTLVTGLAEGENPALVSATQTVRAEGGDYSGLAALSCVRPATSARFLAGDTLTGSDTRLVVANPGTGPVSVEISASGEGGEIALGAGADLSLQPGETRAIVLGALVGQTDVLGVDVSATGGLVGSVLQVVRRDGLTPRGIEYGQAVAAPARAQEIPVATAGRGRLKVTNPSDEAVTVTLSGTGVDGGLPLASDRLSIPAHGTAAADLGDVGPGTVRVESPTPVSSGITLYHGEDEGAEDLAEIPAAAALAQTQLVSVPRGASTDLVFGPLRGETAEPVKLTGLREDGSPAGELDLGLSGDRSTVVDLDTAFGQKVFAVRISTPTGAEVVAGGIVDTEAGVSALTVPPAPSGIGYRNVRLTN